MYMYVHTCTQTHTHTSEAKPVAAQYFHGHTYPVKLVHSKSLWVNIAGDATIVLGCLMDDVVPFRPTHTHTHTHTHTNTYILCTMNMIYIIRRAT